MTSRFTPVRLPRAPPKTNCGRESALFAATIHCHRAPGKAASVLLNWQVASGGCDINAATSSIVSITARPYQRPVSCWPDAIACRSYLIGPIIGVSAELRLIGGYRRAL